VKIAPGGQTIRGRVVSTAGEPISGARITAYAGRRNINLRTDADGRFQISGLSKNDNEIYPTVSHQDFTAKDGFQQPLDADGITEVEWRLEPGCIVTGRVTAQADGRPLGGIQIVSGSDRFASNRANPETTTDEDGRFRLGGVKAGTAMVHAISRQFVPMLVNVNTSLDQPATADFALVTGKPISGRVVDPEGKPVAGVTAAIDTINGARMLDRRVDTNANGEFRYENMPDTPVKIDMFKQGWVSKRDFESKGGEHAEITLYPVVEHIVRIRDADTDKPPKDLTSQIGYQWSGREEISWQEEDYSDNSEYDPSSGLLKIHVDEPSSSAKLFWRLRAPGYKEVVLPNPEIGTPAKSFDVVMEKVATTRGTVVNADTNEPIPGVLVALVSKQDRLRPDYYTNFNSGFEAIESFTGYHATTAADGTFEISRPAAESGVDLVLYSKTGGFHFIPDAHAALAGSGVKLPLPSPATVEGRVVVAGQTIAGAPVHLSWIAPGDRPRSYELPFGFGGQVETDSQGRFRYTGLGPGNYQVSRVRRFEYPSGGGSSYTFITSQEVLVLPGQTVTHDFVQPIGPKISGQVVNPDGKPAGFCQASLTLAGSQNRQADATYTQGNGRFEFENVQPGTYSIRIQEYVATQWGGFGPTGGNANTTVKVADSDVATTITLVPRPESRTPNAAPRATATLSFVAASPNASNSMAGALPPDFRGKVFGTDKTFQLSDNYGKVVIVAFWASWSGSFATVMPELQQLYEKHKGSDDVVFVIVSFDRTAEALQAAIVEQELEIPVIYESRESGHNIAKGFGMVGVPSSFVIGRDGRLASERVYNNQLISIVDAALKAPAPPQLPTGGKPARLTINLSLDGDASGLPGATLTVKSFNDVGMPVNEEVLRTVGPAPKLTWFHPPLDERGSMEVKAEAEGVESQQQTVKASGDSAELTFKFSSPRAIRGTVLLAAENEGADPKNAAASLSPAPNMKVAAYSMNGIRRDATTDADGKFEMRVMPGTYFIVPISNEKFAAVSVERQQLNVAADQDPEPLELSVCPSVTVSGTVTDENDQPVAGAEVRTPLTEKPAITDNQGRFQLSGVPSRGTVQLIATKQPKFAVVNLENCDGKEPQTLVLGDQPGGAERRLAKGMKAPKLPLVSLSDGEPVDWQPAAGRETLLLFGPLWHPGTRDLVMRAEAWADEHQADLATISTDWSLDQARREAASYADVLPAGDAILFAGPGGLELAKTWALQGQAQAYLLSPDGKKIGAVPPPGKLP
jgi:5-hydroxyisourate hydrolase-like protein (transthyretin family)/thiol-disulfide isomerase/thioredoxin